MAHQDKISRSLGLKAFDYVLKRHYKNSVRLTLLS